MTSKWGSDLPPLRTTSAFERWRFAQAALNDLPKAVASGDAQTLAAAASVSDPIYFSAKRRSDCVASAARAREFSHRWHTHLNSLRDATKLEFDCYTAWKITVAEEAQSRAELVAAWHSNHISEWMHKLSACWVEESAARSRFMDVFYEYQEWMEEKFQQSAAAARESEQRRLDHEASVRRAMDDMAQAALREEAARRAALDELRLQEARLRQAHAAAQQRQEAERQEAERASAAAEARREAQRREMQAKLEEEERLIQHRIQQRQAALAEAEKQREEERRTRLQQIAAEEEALKQKLEQREREMAQQKRQQEIERQKREQELEQQRREEQSRLLTLLLAEEQHLTERLSQRERRALDARDDEVARLQREERRLREVIETRERLHEEEKRRHAESRAVLLEHCKAEEQILQERRYRRAVSPQPATEPPTTAPPIQSDVASQLAFVRAQEEKLARRLAARVDGSTVQFRDVVLQFPPPPPPPPYSSSWGDDAR